MSKNNQIKTIMSAEDEAEFISFAESLVDRVNKESEFQYFLFKGDNKIQFLRSRLKEGVLLEGRIAISLLQEGEVEAIVKVYRKLQRWIKKHYFNKLTVRNINIADSKQPCSDMWLAPCAKDLVMESKVVLSQNPKAIVVFEIDEQS